MSDAGSAAVAGAAWLCVASISSVAMFIRKRVAGDAARDGRGRGRAVAVATWNFGHLAVEAAAVVLRPAEAPAEAPGAAVDAVTAGANAVELNNDAQYYVGYGGLPNSDGDVELDAAVMDGRTRLGAVMALRGCRSAVRVARKLIDCSPHSVLAGDGAAAFARAHGFPTEAVLSEGAAEAWRRFRKGVEDSAGRAAAVGALQSSGAHAGRTDFAQGGGAELPHDTVGVLALDARGRLAAATSTSGWAFCAPGRVGDAPLVGSGLYAVDGVGAAVATGDGEQVMRACLAFLVVERMRAGDAPQQACDAAIARLRETLRAAAAPAGAGREAEEALWEAGSPLCVSVLALCPRGRVGAATTIGPLNPNGGQGACFPFAVWRDGEGGGTLTRERVVDTLQAGLPQP